MATDSHRPELPSRPTPASDAISDWAPLLSRLREEALGGGSVSIRDELPGGRSGAKTYIVDLLANPTRSAELDGQYVLKLDEIRRWEGEEPRPEGERHARVFAEADQFAREHVPKLLWSAQEAGKTAALYELAGHRQMGLSAADAMDSGALAGVLKDLGGQLLTGLATPAVHQDVPASQLLTDWLGYRLDPVRGARLHERVRAMAGEEAIWVCAGELLPNPLAFCSHKALSASKHAAFYGLGHGDLHLGNVLASATTRPPRWWLIDFALSDTDALLYDHAYLELGLLLGHLRGVGPERLVALMKAGEADRGSAARDLLALDDVGVRDGMTSIREVARAWQTASWPNRVDDFEVQELLARVAVGLNWVNKPGLDVGDQLLSLVYAAWAARAFMRRFADESWKGMTAHMPVGTPAPGADPDVQNLWQALGGFDDAAARFVLVSGPQAQPENFKALAALPWSAVIDLDTDGDQSGLYSEVAATLSERRALHAFGLQQSEAHPARSTSWMFAAGWSSRGERGGDVNAWRRTYLPLIRNLADRIRAASAPLSTCVVVLAGSVDRRMLDRTLEAVDEGFAGAATTFVVSADDSVGATVDAVRLQITEIRFARALRSLIGEPVSQIVGPTLPGGQGKRVPVPYAIMRDFEEDLAVLHSDVLDAERLRPRESDEFWRGSPPTWTDLAGGADVPRAIHEPLVGALTHALGESAGRTFELRHDPGAGGTTAALRAAWALHYSHPVAVVRAVSALTVDRVDRLFHLAGRPVLLVVDGASVTYAQREAMFRGFAERNARVVTLHVVRRRRSADEPGNRQTLELVDPMTKDEAHGFAEIYSQQTTDGMRQGRLKDLARQGSLERFRSPFFFGLTTYERDFQSIEGWVDAHLRGLDDTQKLIMRRLALTSRFSQLGIHTHVLRYWFGVDDNETLDLEALLGALAARLLACDEHRCHVVHPLVAEQMLARLLGSPDTPDPELWKSALGEASIEFIDAISEVVRPDDAEAHELFTQLFVERGFLSETGGRRPNFSDLILMMPQREAAYRVFKRLTEMVPDEPHYWNHLGRFHIYEMRYDPSEAVEFLQRAVSLASSTDGLHHHTLGMVRRFGIERSIERMLESGVPVSPEAMLAEIELSYVTASEDFRRAREINPADEAAHVTPVQMFLYVASRLVQIDGENSDIRALAVQDTMPGRWVRSNLAVAEDLLGELLRQRPGREPSKYVLRCQADLQDLYGDYEALIDSWEALLPRATDRVDLSRLLASTYLARRDRVWAQVPSGELRRIAALTEDNLRADPTNPWDLRTWFQASRRLPEFDVLRALDRLNGWAARVNAPDAYYYLYILHFLLWRTGQEQTERSIRENINRCRDAGTRNRQFSFEWLAEEPAWCPLANIGDLRGWDVTDEKSVSPIPLERVTGVIDRIDSPRSGRLRVGDGHITAFFVPRTDFWQASDVGAVVEFTLGFSYEGLRAWRVARPVSATLASGSGETSQDELWKALRETVATPRVGETTRDGPVGPTRAKAFSFVVEYVRRYGPVRVTDLATALGAEFEDPKLAETLGFRSTEQLLAKCRGVKVENGAVRRSGSPRWGGGPPSGGTKNA